MDGIYLPSSSERLTLAEHDLVTKLTNVRLVRSVKDFLADKAYSLWQHALQNAEATGTAGTMDADHHPGLRCGLQPDPELRSLGTLVIYAPRTPYASFHLTAEPFEAMGRPLLEHIAATQVAWLQQCRKDIIYGDLFWHAAFCVGTASKDFLRKLYDVLDQHDRWLGPRNEVDPELLD